MMRMSFAPDAVAERLYNRLISGDMNITDLYLKLIETPNIDLSSTSFIPHLVKLIEGHLRDQKDPLRKKLVRLYQEVDS